MKKLYAVYLGGKAVGANIEVHDIVFLTSEDILSDTDLIKEKWFGDKKSVHIDAIAEIDKVDGYEIRVDYKNNSDKKLFFINFGANANGKLTELHESGFFISADKSEAISKAKLNLLSNQGGVHLDNLYEIDDCLNISDMYDLLLVETENTLSSIKIQNLYKRI